MTYFMRNVYVLSLAIIISACSSYKQVETFKHVANKGYSEMKYRFSDNGNRNVDIFFTNDSTLVVINRPNTPQNYYLLYFKCVYSYKLLEINSIKIENTFECDKALSKNKYLMPYQNKQYSLDPDAVKYIFPNLIGDTIRFSSDFQKLQVREFNFDRIRN